MRIVYYLPSLYMSGGLERIITLKANYFADSLGYEVLILTSEQLGRKPYFALSPRVKQVDLAVHFDYPPGQSFLTKLVRYPFRYHAFRKKFALFLEKYRPDITISTLRRELNFINSLCDGSVKIGEFHVTRYAYHANAVTANHPIKKYIKERWARSFVRNLSKLSKLVLLTREEQANWPELNNTVVINNPLTLTPSRVAACDSKQVIAVGRYAYQKGFDILVDTWKIVHERHPEWTLSIYGEGDATSLKKQIHSLKLEGSCLLRPPVANIVEKYMESSIFVLSSRFEGFGMVIVEAMACGVPPVAFACPCGPKDIIEHGKDGLLVEPGNLQALAEGICQLIEQEEVRKEMGRQARISSARFAMDRIASQWDSLFNSLIK